MTVAQSDIEKYDRAVYEYLTTISGKIIYAPTSVAVNTITRREEFSDKKPWNFISFYRDSLFDIDWGRMNNSIAVSGDFIRLRGSSCTDREARYVHNIPVNLTYHVELWATKAVEAHSLAEDLITKLFMQEQVLEVPINPDGEMGRFHFLNITWNDNSDLESETERGKLYRHTISFTIDARITFTRDVKTTKFCCPPIDIYDNYDQYVKDGIYENNCGRRFRIEDQEYNIKDAND